MTKMSYFLIGEVVWQCEYEHLGKTPWGRVAWQKVYGSEKRCEDEAILAMFRRRKDENVPSVPKEEDTG